MAMHTYTFVCASDELDYAYDLKLDYGKILQAKYFTGEKILIYSMWLGKMDPFNK